MDFNAEDFNEDLIRFLAERCANYEPNTIERIITVYNNLKIAWPVVQRKYNNVSRSRVSQKKAAENVKNNVKNKKKALEDFLKATRDFLATASIFLQHNAIIAQVLNAPDIEYLQNIRTVTQVQQFIDSQSQSQSYVAVNNFASSPQSHTEVDVLGSSPPNTELGSEIESWSPVQTRQSKAKAKTTKTKAKTPKTPKTKEQSQDNNQVSQLTITMSQKLYLVDHDDDDL